MKYRSIFISDVHLGTKMAQADKLLKFLQQNDCDNLYLVGDIIDGWALKNSFYWPQEHNNVVQHILRKSKTKTKVIYVPGNHDEFIRDYLDDGKLVFGNIIIDEEYKHLGLNGKTYLIIHGDRFDAVIQKAKWLAHLGSHAYDISIFLTVWLNRIRKLFGWPHWSLAGVLKYKVKTAVNFIGNYEKVLRGYAEKEKVQGIICGHIHHKNNKMIYNIHYINCGDWVETCSAVVEHLDGTWEVFEIDEDGKHKNSICVLLEKL